MSIDLVPEEIMMKIFCLMTPKDLKMLVLVCRMWKEIGEHPRLWSWCQVRLASTDDLEKLNIRRLQQLQDVCVYKWGWQSEGAMDQLYQTLGRLTKLRRMSGLFSSTPAVPQPALLGVVISRLEELNLEDAYMTKKQTQAVFAALTGQDVNIKTLNLTGNNLSFVPPAILARVVQRLEKVDLFSNYITHNQAQAVFAALEGLSEVKELSINMNNLSSVQPAVLVRVVCMIREVYLSCVEITGDQAQALFEAIAKQSTLKFLFISGNDLSMVQTTILATAVNNLEWVNLMFCCLSVDQITSILTQSVEHGTKLKEFYLHEKDLAGVNLDLIQRAEEIFHIIVQY